MQIEVRHARVVAALAEAGSISRAAQRLTLPQPSLTMQLRRIESALGGPLFVRSNSGISPTVLGERIIPLMVELAERADEIVSESSSMSSGVIRVATAEWTPVGLRSELAERLPDVELQTVTLDAARCVQAVSDDAHTACVVPCAETEDPLRGVDADLLSEVIFREPMWLALPSGHPLAGAELADRARLDSLTWVRHQRGHWFHVLEREFFGRLELAEPEVVHHAAGQAEAMAWVTGAGAAALVSPTGPLVPGVALVAPEEAVWRKVLLVSRRGAVSPDRLRGIAEAVRENYCALARRVPAYWSWLRAHRSEFRELDAHLDAVTSPF
ncbi:LysR family transcriptional regulator [Saccharopolyspora sp. MS10]|uniref:LysR family transcriptional regulator n=1 Tax=Saccharopolyspora sp. MS10 TaxID=3385973 RepID=UPI0039A04946